MRYRYLDDFPRGILVFAIFSYGIAVLGTPPPHVPLLMITTSIFEIFFFQFPSDKAVDPHLQSLPPLFLND